MYKLIVTGPADSHVLYGSREDGLEGLKAALDTRRASGCSIHPDVTVSEEIEYRVTFPKGGFELLFLTSDISAE